VQSDWTSASLTRSTSGEIQSTNNPRQSPHIYYLAFLIPPLIGSILDALETTDSEAQRFEAFTQVTNLLRTVAASKIDTYNDLLEIVAYRGPKPRRLAIASLAELWPKSVGHAVISSPFYPTGVSGTSPSKTSRSSHFHQFAPWYFESKYEHTRTDGTFHHDCRSCLKPIRGFSLMCPSCMTAVHFDCYDYPEGNYQIQYSMENDRRVQGIAMCRFSEVHTNETPLHEEVTHNHSFIPSNWFTLCLCFVCQNPLWGCFAQGLKCGQCPIALHRKCVPLLSSSKQCGKFEITSKVVTIDWKLLRQSCLDHFPILHYTPHELNGRSFEEILVYHSFLRTQLQILTNGLAFGSIVVHDGRNTSQQTHNDFELHSIVEQTGRLLDLQRLAFSPLTQQYLQGSNNNIIQNTPSIMFNWSFLEYVTAAIKTSSPQSHHTPATTSDFLNVEQPHDLGTNLSESTSLPYESATLTHIRSILGADFALRSDDAAKFILDHLHHLAFLDRMDGHPYPFQDIALEKDLKCIFPLPLGLDLSMNVETLVSSIEACLSDLDLSTNEFGFLLLTRRFWPNGLASEYGLKRLAVRVLAWILAEVRFLLLQICDPNF
jgi:hypothetical protein